jgi:predicted RNA-binding protein with PUA domain
MAVMWCKHCDNITHLKRKCKMCKGKGIIQVGKGGIWRG